MSEVSHRELTITELAFRLKVSESTIRRMMQNGCPYLLAGKRPRFDLIKVNSWREQQCQSEKMPLAVGMSNSASIVKGFTDAYQKARLRVMPSA